MNTVTKQVKAPCADFTKMAIEGFTFDRSASGLDYKTDNEVAAFMREAMDKGLPLPKCVFKK